jgi:hypothetical protein
MSNREKLLWLKCREAHMAIPDFKITNDMNVISGMLDIFQKLITFS